MNSILKKFLFSAVMINAMAPLAVSDDAFTYETFSQSINRALNKYFTTEIILLLITVLILLIIVAVFFEARRSKKIKQELLALAMAKFDFLAEKLNLRLSSVVVLKRIAQKSELHDPSSLMKFSHVFENSLEKYYESEQIESLPDEMLALISTLRKELGFSPLPRGIALTSTRQLFSGYKCTIQIPENDPPIPQEICYVLDCEERRWSITRPKGPQVQTGTLAIMSLTKPGDAEYTFKTHVLEDSSKELFLRHTNNLERTQQRNWLRVDVNIPVNATLMEEARMGDTLSGTIIDISGGGLSMILPVKLQSDSVLLLNFKLPGHGQIMDLPVKVVRVIESSAGKPSKIVYSVAFENEINLIREKIIKYVFEKQRENLMIRQPY